LKKPPEKEDIDCADALLSVSMELTKLWRNNLEYPDVTVEKYTSNETDFRASKEVQTGIDDYTLVLSAQQLTNRLVADFSSVHFSGCRRGLAQSAATYAKNGSDFRKLQAAWKTLFLLKNYTSIDSTRSSRDPLPSRSR